MSLIKKLFCSVKSDVEIIGHCEYCEKIIFKLEDKFLSCKFNLPNNFLVLDLGISPSDINKYLKNEIQEKARDGGKWKARYKFEDGSISDNYFKYIDIKGNCCVTKKSVYGTKIYEKM